MLLCIQNGSGHDAAWIYLGRGEHSPVNMQCSPATTLTGLQVLVLLQHYPSDPGKMEFLENSDGKAQVQIHMQISWHPSRMPIAWFLEVPIWASKWQMLSILHLKMCHTGVSGLHKIPGNLSWAFGIPLGCPLKSLLCARIGHCTYPTAFIYSWHSLEVIRLQTKRLWEMLWARQMLWEMQCKTVSMDWKQSVSSPNIHQKQPPSLLIYIIVAAIRRQKKLILSTCKTSDDVMALFSTQKRQDFCQLLRDARKLMVQKCI